MMRISTVLSLLVISCLSYGQTISFTDASDLLPTGRVSDHAVGVCDMNDDGLDDIVRMRSYNDGPETLQDVYVALQQGNGEDFIELLLGTMEVPGTGSADAWGLCISDLDRNGVNDLSTGGFYNGVYNFLANADGTSFNTDIEAEGEIFVQGMNSFDIDNDGHLDLFVCDDNEISQILLNNGDGTFEDGNAGLFPESDQPSDGSGNYGSVFMDVDNNGHCDLYIAKCRQGVQSPTDPRRINLLFLNDGEGTWTSAGVEAGIDIGAQSWSADFGDMDNDGDLDLIVGNHDAISQFFTNDGTGVFTEQTFEAGLNTAFQYLVIQTTFMDFNNDGFLDIIGMGNGSHTIALNDGDGTFTKYNDFFGVFPTNSYGLGDLNNDGYIDIYCTANGYGGWGQEIWEDRLFMNDGGDNHYVKVELQGVESNINGIGSRITINGPWGTQIRDVKSGESYGISNSLFQHFGLGEETIIPELIVTWPSGEVDTFFDVDADQTLVITEGSGVSSLEELPQIDLDVFPNPVQDEMRISMSASDWQEDMFLRLMDMSGRTVYEERVAGPMTVISIEEVAQGILRYQLVTPTGSVATGSLVKQ